MKKPELKNKLYYDYQDCKNYVCEKYELSEDEFWDYKSDYCDGNGSYLYIDKDDLEEFDSDNNSDGYRFVQSMIKEFGPEAAYYIYW